MYGMQTSEAKRQIDVLAGRQREQQWHGEMKRKKKSKGEKKMKERKMKKEARVSTNKLLNTFSFLYIGRANIGTVIELRIIF